MDISKIEIKDVNFSYKEVKVYKKNLNMCLEKGSIYLIKGKNGSGKSTLAGILLKIWNDFSGTILLDGKRIIGKKHQLKWCTYQQLENNRYPTADVVIFHFTKEIIERERAFAAIIKIKGSLGHLTPILAISEGGSIQDIFSILKAGAYDYIETIDNTRKYKKKIENLILWNWYIKKHTSAKKRQC